MKKDVAAIIEGNIQQYIDKWQFLTDAIGMEVTHSFLPTVNTDDRDAVANTTAYWQYSTATIKWWLGHAATCSLDDLEDTVVHEFVHCLIASLEGQVDESERYSDLSEYSVQNVTKALLDCAHRQQQNEDEGDDA